MIHRKIYDSLRADIGKGKVLILYGPRRVGKTTVAKKLQVDIGQKSSYFNCDLNTVRDSLVPDSLARLESVIGSARTIVIDEAQRVENIGLTLKILIDAHPDLNIIATGSASFDLSNKIKEPLTGRAYEHYLLPLSLSEIAQSLDINKIELPSMYEQLMRYGAYPGIFTLPEAERERELDTIIEKYIYKDSLEIVEMRQRQILPRLLQALALQIGSDVSYNELSNLLNVKSETVERYITLLEESFIVYRLNALTGNQRSQLSNRKRKVYFVDLGVRNALINNFNPMASRNDAGALWENFCINELRKKHINSQTKTTQYYWRGISGEVDLVENSKGEWKAFECKYGDKKPKIPLYFKQLFPDLKVEVLNPTTLGNLI
jgi:uncharacterized protein